MGFDLAPERTTFKQVVVDGRKLRKGMLGAFNLDYGRGDPVLVPTQVRKGRFHVDAWHPEG